MQYPPLQENPSNDENIANEVAEHINKDYKSLLILIPTIFAEIFLLLVDESDGELNWAKSALFAIIAISAVRSVRGLILATCSKN